MSIMRTREPRQQKLETPAPGPEKTYRTTAGAGFVVAGRRVEAAHGKDASGAPTLTPVVGAVIWLSDAAAQYPLSQGEITLMSPQPRSASAADVEAALSAQAGSGAGATAPAPSPAAPAPSPAAPAPASPAKSSS